jgi:hypothetical protein
LKRTIRILAAEPGYPGSVLPMRRVLQTPRIWERRPRSRTNRSRPRSLPVKGRCVRKRLLRAHCQRRVQRDQREGRITPRSRQSVDLSTTVCMASTAINAPTLAKSSNLPRRRLGGTSFVLDLIWTLRPAPYGTARERSHVADQVYSTLRTALNRLQIASGSSSRKGVEI